MSASAHSTGVFWGTVIAGVALVAAVVGGVALRDSLVKADREARKIVWKGDCPVDGLTFMGGLRVTCNGQEKIINDDGLKFSYALNPGPFKCDLQASGWISCDLRPFKPAQ